MAFVCLGSWVVQGELSGFKPCSSQQTTDIENCAWFNGTDDEGGDRFLTNPVEVTGLNAVLYDEVCVGGDHCSPAWNVGRAMLFASDDTADIFLWDGWEPVKLIRCEGRSLLGYLGIPW